MPTITVELNDEANRLIEIYQASKELKTKQEAINQIIEEAKALILKSVK